MLAFNQIDLTVDGLAQHYRQGDFTPTELIRCLLDECRFQNDNPVWITLLNEEQLTPYLKNLESQSPADLPLYGVPFAIKDNIDLADVPTTAACPDFTYTPTESAFVVQQLITAGAIPLGKTNMDQFATGLVGVRSPEPWGPCKNALNDKFISGGSSSGSAVAVAKGWATFSLGTDTAGSGRVPASLNDLVGLKPSKGLLSTRGVVPACKSLDCVSIFATNIKDANTIFDVAAQFDPLDPYARKNNYANGKRYFKPINTKANAVKVGVPQPEQLEFFGNKEAKSLFQQSITELKQLGIEIIEIDFAPFLDAAKLLYEGPWVAERYLAVQKLIETSPESLLPVIKTIVGKGNSFSALDAFSYQYKLQALSQQANAILETVDAIATPTAGTIYTIDQVLNDPIQLNSNMGYYTNFMNLLDCAAVSTPTGFYKNGVGFGITLFHQALSDKRLLSIAATLQNALEFKSDVIGTTTLSPSDKINVVVCGAHLEGLPLNWQLTERGAILLEKTFSAPHYKFYALAGGPLFRPGMVRTTENGAAIEVEVWQLPKDNFGSFVAEIPAPLGIGKVELADGRWESGFICDGWGLEGAKDISEFGSWRKYMAELAKG